MTYTEGFASNLDNFDIRQGSATVSGGFATGSSDCVAVHNGTLEVDHWAKTTFDSSHDTGGTHHGLVAIRMPSVGLGGYTLLKMGGSPGGVKAYYLYRINADGSFTSLGNMFNTSSYSEPRLTADGTTIIADLDFTGDPPNPSSPAYGSAIDDTWETQTLAGLSGADGSEGLRVKDYEAGPAAEGGDDLAEVSTLTASDVTHNSATLNGEVTTLGDEADATVRFRYREQGTGEWASTGGQQRTATGAFTESVAGLLPGTGYEFEAIVDDGDNGATLSFETDAATPGPSAPASPVNVAVAATGINSIQLTWDAPPRGGPKVTGYRIERESPTGDGWAALVGNTGSPATGYHDTGLAGATEYNYRVAGINAAGIGDFSSARSATTEPPFAPSPPLGFSASYDAESGDASLAWDPPVDDGGAAITHYVITRLNADGHGETLETGSTHATYLDTDVPAGEWTYRVAAENSVGIGQTSDPQQIIVAGPANAGRTNPFHQPALGLGLGND